MILSLNNLDITRRIKELRLYTHIDLIKGRDNLDQISLDKFNSYDYCYGLAIYNDVINPFKLIEQNIIRIKIFNKNDYDNLMREFYK